MRRRIPEEIEKDVAYLKRSMAMIDSLKSEGYDVNMIWNGHDAPQNVIMRSDGEHRWVVGYPMGMDGGIVGEKKHVEVVWLNESDAKRHKPDSWEPLEQVKE